MSDVVQEAYLAAFRSLAEFEERGEGSFARWLARILERKVKDEARRYLGTAKRDARIERRPDGEAGVGAAHGPGPTPSAALAVREDQHAVRLALASLPDDYRTVLLLVHSSGLTFEQIGVAQARSANAVSKLYGRALRALAEALRGAGDPRRGA